MSICTDCVLVAYKPNIEILNSTLASLCTQVRMIYLVNNFDQRLSFDFPNVCVIDLKKNMGIAYAQNIGIKRSIENNADFILLSDQDTQFPLDFIPRLVDLYQNKRQNFRIAAVCPLFFDNIKNEYQTIMKSKFVHTNPFADRAAETFVVEHAIASGMLISRKALEDIGYMNEELFIDYVDTEWCWRAKSKQYKVLATSTIIIKHNLGDTPIRFLGKKYTLRSNTRYYYIIRNAIFLCTGGISLKWYEVALFYKRILKMSIGIILLNFNSLTFRLLVKAYSDGLLHRLGKINSE